jgi:hypothetical protein
MRTDRYLLRIRTFFIGEAMAFGVAAVVHAGLPVEGYEHRDTIILESVLVASCF